MSAFCDVILAELHRLEALTSDKAKSDFISTMSHELRSPLHGILGSVECLQEQPTDSISADLISQVDICGRTLLDVSTARSSFVEIHAYIKQIIDHLLDFSKINHHAKSRAGAMIDTRGHRMPTNAAKRTRMGGMMTLSADIALDHVTEEVIETAVYSFCCSRDPELILNRKVAVILDIERGGSLDWKCYVAVGAWKRICINLVSNALKYTSEGHIRISLKASPNPDKKKRFNVTLNVSDTGRGMSRDFLENHLFRAFQQEDSFVEGTGLGMNLVAKIVKAFEGKIVSCGHVANSALRSLTISSGRSLREGRRNIFLSHAAVGAGSSWTRHFSEERTTSDRSFRVRLLRRSD
jgi:signal transduction histidine kinase